MRTGSAMEMASTERPKAMGRELPASSKRRRLQRAVLRPPRGQPWKEAASRLPALLRLRCQPHIRRPEVEPRALAQAWPQGEPTKERRLVVVQAFGLADCVPELKAEVWFLDCGTTMKWVRSVSSAVLSERRGVWRAVRPVSAQRRLQGVEKDCSPCLVRDATLCWPDGTRVSPILGPLQGTEAPASARERLMTRPCCASPPV